MKNNTEALNPKYTLYHIIFFALSDMFVLEFALCDIGTSAFFLLAFARPIADYF